MAGFISPVGSSPSLPTTLRTTSSNQLVSPWRPSKVGGRLVRAADKSQPQPSLSALKLPSPSSPSSPSSSHSHSMRSFSLPNASSHSRGQSQSHSNSNTNPNTNPNQFERTSNDSLIQLSNKDIREINRHISDLGRRRKYSEIENIMNELRKRVKEQVDMSAIVEHNDTFTGDAQESRLDPQPQNHDQNQHHRTRLRHGANGNRSKVALPNSYTFNAYLDATIRCLPRPQARDKVYEILNEMITLHIDPSVVTLNIALKCSPNVQQALQFMNEFQKQFGKSGRAKLNPDVITYNTLIHMAAREKSPALCQQLYDEMVGSRIQPDGATFSSLIYCHVVMHDFSNIIASLLKFLEGFQPSTLYSPPLIVALNGLIEIGCPEAVIYLLRNVLFREIKAENQETNGYENEVAELDKLVSAAESVCSRSKGFELLGKLAAQFDSDLLSLEFRSMSFYNIWLKAIKHCTRIDVSQDIGQVMFRILQGAYKKGVYADEITLTALAGIMVGGLRGQDILQGSIGILEQLSELGNLTSGVVNAVLSSMVDYDLCPMHADRDATDSHQRFLHYDDNPESSSQPGEFCVTVADARKVLQWAESKNVHPDSLSITILIDHCATCYDIASAEELIQLVERETFPSKSNGSKTPCHNALMKTYRAALKKLREDKSGSPEDVLALQIKAEELMEKMVKQGLADTTSFNTHLDIMSQDGDVISAKHDLMLMERLNVPADAATLNMLLKSLVRGHGTLTQARQLMKTPRFSHGIRYDNVTYKLLIDLASKSGDLEQAENYFRKTLSHGLVHPNAYTALMRAHLKKGDERNLKRVLDLYEQYNESMSPPALNILLTVADTYARLGNETAMKQIFVKVRNSRLLSEKQIYVLQRNMLLKAMCKTGSHRTAWSIVYKDGEEASLAGDVPPPPLSAYNLMIFECIRAKEHRLLIEVLRRMEELGIKPDAITARAYDQILGTVAFQLRSLDNSLVERMSRIFKLAAHPAT